MHSSPVSERPREGEGLLRSHRELVVHLVPGVIDCPRGPSLSSLDQVPHSQVCSLTLLPRSPAETLETGRAGAINPVIFQNPES